MDQQQTQWDLSVFYPNEEAFLSDIEKLKSFIPEVKKFQGKIASEEGLAGYLTLDKKFTLTYINLAFFASMRADRDRRNVENTSDESKVELAVQSYIAEASYFEPELLAYGQDNVNAFFAKHPEFSEYSFSFEKLFRGQKHVLDAEKEKLLSSYAPLHGEGGNLYSLLTVADYKPKEVTLSDGSKKEINLSNWTSLIAETKKPEDRQAIFECLYSWYDEHKNTYGEIYNSVLQDQLAIQKSRGYESILEEHLFNNAIPTSVFHNLIDVASSEKGSAPLKKYYELRRKYLGLEKHRSYDRFLQLAKSNKKYTYEEAKDLFFASLKDFPEDFQNKAKEVLRPGYVDVYPSLGKRTGAYSNGGYDHHPFILLNFQGELDDVFTLAHESGHSMHTLYSEESQPTLKQDYTIFVAEIASTFNEHNLLDYLLASGTLSREDRIALLQKAIDEICSTFYRQTLFGHYEYEASLLAEKGEPINYQVLSSIMTRLYKQYYGIDIEEEKLKPLVWAYIPHLFYTPFYVYQYATSFTSSMLIYEKVKAKEPEAFASYVNLLRSGGSDFPIEQVKKAGVDLTSKEPFEAVVSRMSELVDLLEKELEAK